MILAVFQNTSHIETLLNNLSEADFDLDEVSVLLMDVDLRNKIARDTGPLKGVGPPQIAQKLVELGISKLRADLCQKAVREGKVLVIMGLLPENEKAAEEMFTDHSAQLMKE